MAEQIFNSAGTEVTVRKTPTGFDYKEKGSDIWREMTFTGGEPPPEPEEVPHALRVVEVTGSSDYTMVEEDFYNTLILLKPSVPISLNIPAFAGLAVGAIATLAVYTDDGDVKVYPQGTGGAVLFGGGATGTGEFINMITKGSVATIIYIATDLYIITGGTVA